jgi:FKBP-type peptidyl-prolyl cis-trans isomerase
MTQTVRSPDKQPQRQHRPGQRQQERLQRRLRRKRRLQVWIASSIALVLIAAGILGIWRYQQNIAQQTEAANKVKNQQATATANVQATASAAAEATATVAVNATATANVQATATALAPAMKTALAGSPTPSSGPASPPKVSGTPVKLEGGLEYIDVRVGTGPAAKEGSTLMVEYTGWLADDGKKFDSSWDHGGTPFELTPLGQANVISGWNKGLVGIKAGGTRRLIIPPEMAYGAQGSPPVIPPNAKLIFDVTVLTVK